MRLLLEGSVNGDRSQGGIPVQIKSIMALTSMGIQVLLASGDPVGCVSLTFKFLIQMQNPMRVDTHIAFCISTSYEKR